MRKIKVEKWASINPEGKEVEETILDVISLSIQLTPADALPKGIEYFKTFSRFVRAIESAEKTGELLLEEKDYNYLKQSISTYIPANLGFNKNIVEAVDKFLNAKEE